MYVYGSAFYAMMFLVTFPAFSSLDEPPAKKQTLCYFVMHALACGMAVSIVLCQSLMTAITEV